MLFGRMIFFRCNIQQKGLLQTTPEPIAVTISHQNNRFYKWFETNFKRNFITLAIITTNTTTELGFFKNIVQKDDIIAPNADIALCWQVRAL